MMLLPRRELFKPSIIRPDEFKSPRGLTNAQRGKLWRMNRRDLMKGGAIAVTASIMPRLADAGVTVITLGSDIPTAISGATNTTFQLSSGIYRQAMFTLPTSNAVMGWFDGSSVVSGAWTLGGATWTNTAGANWSATTGAYDNSGGQQALTGGTGRVTLGGDTSGGGNPLANAGNNLWVNNVYFVYIGTGTTGAPLVPTAGQWWWNTTNNSVNVCATGLGTFPGTNLIEYGNFARAGGWGPGSGAAFNVTLANFTCEKYPAAIGGGIIGFSGCGIQLHGMTFQWATVGINATTYDAEPVNGGPSLLIRSCKFLNCGQYGINLNNSRGAWIYDSEIAGNNQAGFNNLDDAGGFKMVYSHHGRISGCYSHGNFGQGMWWDLGCSDWEIDNNVVANNVAYVAATYQFMNGIVCEIGGARYKITNNLVLGHSGHGIYISTNGGTEVSGNIIVVGPTAVTVSGGGIYAANATRTDLNGGTSAGGVAFGASVPLHLTNLYVHDNVIIHTTDTGNDGIEVDVAQTAGSVWTWDHNTYVLPTVGTTAFLFQATNGSGGAVQNFAALRAGGVYEQTGQILVGSPYASLTAAMAALGDNQPPGSLTPAVYRNVLLTWLETLKLPQAVPITE